MTSDPRAFFKWWTPPEIESPSLRLNEDALDNQKLRKKREGMKRFQIPLVPNTTGEGLGIPTTSRREAPKR